MANELITLAAGQSSLPNTYFILYNSVGQVWNGMAFVTASATNRNAGAIVATELGTQSAVYVANCPSIQAGTYKYLFFRRVDETPSELDQVFGDFVTLNWTGTSVLILNTLALASVLNNVSINVDTINTRTENIGFAIGLLPTSITQFDLGNGKTVAYYLKGGFNKTLRTSNTITVCDTDNVTVLQSATLTSDGNLNPIATITPE